MQEVGRGHKAMVQHFPLPWLGISKPLFLSLPQNFLCTVLYHLQIEHCISFCLTDALSISLLTVLLRTAGKMLTRSTGSSQSLLVADLSGEESGC